MSPPTSPNASPARGTYLAAVGFMLASICLGGLMNGLIKWLSADYATLQIICFRAVFGLAPVLAFLWMSGGFGQLRTSRPLGHLIRSLVGGTSMLCAFYGYGHLPLVNAQVLSYATPMFVTIVAMLLFGEVVRLRRWSALAIGFAGIVLVLQPGPGFLRGLADSPAPVIMLCGCLFAGFAANLIRQLSRTESTAAIVFFYTAILAVISSVAAAFAWRTPVRLLDWALLIGLGLMGGVSQLCMTAAYKRAQLSTIAPFEYLMILTALGLGFFVWGEVPTWLTLVGAAVVIASSLYIVLREAQLRLPRPGFLGRTRARE
ncbi:MAG: DMT family transporter [Alphaproteobacteria bacterium]|nr:DMT family transporter [Alphaproteobacteria bacterium]